MISTAKDSLTTKDIIFLLTFFDYFQWPVYMVRATFRSRMTSMAIEVLEHFTQKRKKLFGISPVITHHCID